MLHNHSVAPKMSISEQFLMPNWMPTIESYGSAGLLLMCRVSALCFLAPAETSVALAHSLPICLTFSLSSLRLHQQSTQLTLKRHPVHHVSGAEAHATRR
ncbi:unnamed protein product [Laminaria digitata]